MLDLDLTSPGYSRSQQMPPNETPLYDFLSIIKSKFGCICKGVQVTALCNMPDLDLTFPVQSRSKLIVTSEYMTSSPSLVISFAVSASVTYLCQRSKKFQFILQEKF